MSFRYGYFDAHRSTSEIDGEQVVTYDRTYNVNDFNDYFKYLIEPAGIFPNSGDPYTVNGKLTYSKCKIMYPSSDPNTSPHIVDYDTDGDPETPTVKKLEITISKGKGVLNSHWFIINVPEKVYIPSGETSVVSTSTINYGVFIRYDETTRTVGIVTREVGSSPSTQIPVGYNTSSKKITPNGDGICELYLGYVTVYGKNSKEYRDGKVADVKNLVGSSVCPHVSHLILPDGSADADLYVSQYQDEINDWIERTKEEGGLNQHFDFVKCHIDGGENEPNWINLTDKCGYNYNNYDIIQVYYNGLYLAETGEFRIEIGGNGKTYLIILNGGGTIPTGSVVDVLIIKGSTNDIPNGNNIKY